MTDLTELHKDFIYSNGSLYWNRDNRNRKVKKGALAGTTDSNGYRIVTYKGKKRYVHRLIYYMLHGELPKFIDHINHDKADNRPENLRPADFVSNGRNRKLSSNNKYGVAGVSLTPSNRYRVVIWTGKTFYHIGTYETLEEAASSRFFAESYYGYHPNHGE